MKDRKAIIRALMLKHVYNLPTTKEIIETLKNSLSLCQLCSWDSTNQIPSEATFFRTSKVLIFDWECKRNSEGKIERRCGYKLHITAGDGDIPLSAILNSASLHDSQVAVPMMQMTSQGPGPSLMAGSGLFVCKKKDV